MAEQVAISDAEWQVMNVVWRDQPVEAQQVIDLLAAPNDWSAATIKTMLHRLVKKQALAFDRDGKRYLYRAATRRGDCVRRASRSFLDRVFGGAVAPARCTWSKRPSLPTTNSLHFVVFLMTRKVDHE